MTLKSHLNQSIRLGLVAAGASVLLLTPAQMAQAQSTNNAAAIRQELNLNRSQMRQLRDITQGYQAELADILTAEQLAEMQALREAAQANGQSGSPSAEALIAELNLSEDQVDQLTQARESLEQDLTAVLSPEQMDKLREIQGF
jgi:Spy/CpxP family protein refolding chaperone